MMPVSGYVEATRSLSLWPGWKAEAIGMAESGSQRVGDGPSSSKDRTSRRRTLRESHGCSVRDASEVWPVLGGMPNVTFKAWTPDCALAIRVSNVEYTTRQHLEFELEVLRYLEKIGFNKCPGLRTG